MWKKEKKGKERKRKKSKERATGEEREKRERRERSLVKSYFPSTLPLLSISCLNFETELLQRPIHIAVISSFSLQFY